MAYAFMAMGCGAMSLSVLAYHYYAWGFHQQSEDENLIEVDHTHKNHLLDDELGADRHKVEAENYRRMLTTMELKKNK